MENEQRDTFTARVFDDLRTQLAQRDRELEEARADVERVRGIIRAEIDRPDMGDPYRLLASMRDNLAAALDRTQAEEVCGG